MNLYEVHVRDTLVLRDNRPMVTGAGRSVTMDLPWPSTIAGLARTRLGSTADGKFAGKPDELLEGVELLGPWLVRSCCESQKDPVSSTSQRLFLPAPRDLVWFGDKQSSEKTAYPILPRNRVDGGIYSQTELEIVGMTVDAPDGKAVSGPRYWSWSAYERWIFEGKAPASDGKEVLDGLPEETRTHVALKVDGSRTYEEGQLFTTTQRRYVAQVPAGKNSLDSKRELQDYSVGFAVRKKLLGAQKLSPGHVAFGGERRVARLDGCALVLPSFDGYGKKFEGKQRLKVTLLTPAIFDGGTMPKSRSIGGCRIVAACVPRPEVVSGWDFKVNRPKPTRRVVPSGAVYWLDLGGADPKTVASALWFQSISSNEQDRRDGFGLAVVSPA